MRGGIKGHLRRSGGVYRRVQRLYYAALYAAERAGLGRWMHAWIWKRRTSTSEELERWIAHPRRPWLLRALQPLGPIGSALEVGCNSGANLAVFARAYPHARFHGIDISARAVEVGRAWMRERRLADRVTYDVKSAGDLGSFANGSFDLVLADAVLMYIGDDQVERVLRQMWRIARGRMVLNEWSLPADDSRMHLWWDLHWVHNFHRLLRQIDPTAEIRADRVPADVLGGAGWTDFGTTFVMTARNT